MEAVLRDLFDTQQVPVLSAPVIQVPHKGGNDPVIIMPVGDIQWLGEHGPVATEMLKRHIDWGMRQGAWFLGMGDYIDTLSPSNRARLRAAGLYDTAENWLDEAARGLTEELYAKVLKPSKGRWLGLLRGHHYYQFTTGTTTDSLLCEMLEAPFLGDCAFVRLRFKDPYGHEGSVTIWCHHGVGSGLRTAAPLNRLELVTIHWDADIYLIGHMTRKVAAPIDRVEMVYFSNGGWRSVHRTKVIACTGGFMKGYVEDSKIGREPAGSYVEKAMLNPVALGGLVIRITPRWITLHARQQQGTTSGRETWLPDISVEL